MTRALLALAAVAAMAGAALAEPWGRCDSEGLPALGVVQVTGGSADTTFYVDDRNYLLGNGIWIYQEMNGLWTPKLAGIHKGGEGVDLQRGSPCGGGPPSGDCTVPYESEICWDTESERYGPDLLVF